MNLILTVMVFCIVFPGLALCADGGEWSIGRRTNRVLVDGKLVSGKQDVALEQIVETAKDQMVELHSKDGRGHLIVAAGSKIKVMNDPKLGRLLQVMAGKIRLKVDKAPTGQPSDFNYKVRTKNAVAGVRGTEFFAQFDEAKKHERFCTLEGMVEVVEIASGAKHQVKEGDGVFLDGLFSDMTSLVPASHLADRGASAPAKVASAPPPMAKISAKKDLAKASESISESAAPLAGIKAQPVIVRAVSPEDLKAWKRMTTFPAFGEKPADYDN